VKRAAIAVVLAAVASRAEARPDAPTAADLWRYDAGDLVESIVSPGGGFRIHFTRAGRNAVPAADGDADGTPDFVARTAALYDSALAFYRDQLGFRAPVADGTDGGDARFDVYLLDFGGSADGRFVKERCAGSICSGYMVQENDFAGYAYASADEGTRVVGSHELFHAVQAAYDGDQSSIVSEGTAVWATEQFDPTLRDFEGFVRGYLSRPDHPLDEPLPGPVDPFSYGAAIFFQYLGEREGRDVIRALWEACEDGAGGEADPQWFPALDAVLRARTKTFADVFTDFARANLYTGRRADPTRGYARGDGYGLVRVDGATATATDVARLFHASARYIGLPVGDRASVTAAFVPAPSLPAGAAAPLRLMLAVRRGDVIADPVTIPLDGNSAPPALEVAGADEVIAVLVHSAQTGESIRGSLCLGAPDEVAACAPPPSMMPPVTSSSGCTMARATAPPPIGAAALVVFVLSLIGWWRRRRV
jgi:MYXO-CTERM domain-containing protein